MPCYLPLFSIISHQLTAPYHAAFPDYALPHMTLSGAMLHSMAMLHPPFGPTAVQRNPYQLHPATMSCTILCMATGAPLMSIALEASRRWADLSAHMFADCRVLGQVLSTVPCTSLRFIQHQLSQIACYIRHSCSCNRYLHKWLEAACQTDPSAVTSLPTHYKTITRSITPFARAIQSPATSLQLNDVHQLWPHAAAGKLRTDKYYI
jgi:hypothetical protein